MTGEYVARVFKFYRMKQNPYVVHGFSLKTVPFKTIYKIHKDQFDKFAELAKKNKFDVDSYMRYCVKCGINESTVDSCLSSTTMLNKYVDYVKEAKKLKDIYRDFLKSTREIALECVEEGYFTTKDFLRQIIDSSQLGAYVIAGKISIYYLAAMTNIKEIIENLDYFSKIELKSLYENFEIYHSDINKAFLQEKNKKINPIDYTDIVIEKLREKRKKSKNI